MILIIPSLILLLVKGVRLDSCSLLVVNERGESVEYEKECDAKSKPCVVKCCAPGERMKYVEKGHFVCTSIEELKIEMVPWNFPDDLLESYPGIKIIKDNGDNSYKTLLDFRTLYRKYSHNSKECPTKIIWSHKRTLNMTEDRRNPYISTAIPPMYCYDMLFRKKDGSVAQGYIYITVLDDATNSKIEDTYMAYGALVSAIFLLLTLAVYALLKDLHDKFTGLAMMMVVASLTCVMLCVFVYRVNKMNSEDAGEPMQLIKLCGWLVPLMLFLTNAAFFWMNGLSFAIWCTFRDIENQEISRGGSYRAKFLRYALYAWGSPALFTAFALVMDKYAPDNIIKPQFASCFDDTAEFFHSNKMYFHLPWMTLIMTNIVMYVITIYNIWMAKKDLRNPNFNPTKYKKHNLQFIVFIKLAAVMGVSWTIELAQALSGVHFESFAVTFIMNIPNVFFGVIIFFILVVKKNIIIKLCKRVGIENRWTLRGTQTKSSRTGCSKSRMRSNDDSIELESMNVSNADALKIGDQTKNHAYQSTRV